MASLGRCCARYSRHVSKVPTTLLTTEETASRDAQKQKAPGDAGALIAGDTGRKSVFRDERRSGHVEQVVGADFEDLLIRWQK